MQSHRSSHNCVMSACVRARAPFESSQRQATGFSGCDDESNARPRPTTASLRPSFVAEDFEMGIQISDIQASLICIFTRLPRRRAASRVAPLEPLRDAGAKLALLLLLRVLACIPKKSLKATEDKIGTSTTHDSPPPPSPQPLNLASSESHDKSPRAPRPGSSSREIASHTDLSSEQNLMPMPWMGTQALRMPIPPVLNTL